MIAITRDVSRAIARCELTHLARVPIDYERASSQHASYRAAIASLGCEIVELPADDAFPDSVFVEDAAIVLDDLAVITRPGAASRRGETETIAAALAPHRRLVWIEAPATIDGGDVLVLDDTIFVGRSQRTSQQALDQLASLTGRRVVGVPLRDCLHLKSAITRVGKDLLLLNRSWLDAGPFSSWKLIDVDPAEPFGANALMLGESVIYPAAHPLTRKRLEDHRLDVRVVDADELAKAEGGVTCCSLIVT